MVNQHLLTSRSPLSLSRYIQLNVQNYKLFNNYKQNILNAIKNKCKRERAKERERGINLINVSVKCSPIFLPHPSFHPFLDSHPFPVNNQIYLIIYLKVYLNYY